jgi:hypothetical protein
MTSETIPTMRFVLWLITSNFLLASVLYAWF